MNLLFLVQNFRQGWGGAPESIRLTARRLREFGIASDVFDNGRILRDIQKLEMLPLGDYASESWPIADLANYAAVLQVGPWQHPARTAAILSRVQDHQQYHYLPRGGLADIEFEGGRALKKRLYFAFIERRFFAKADRIVFSSEAEWQASSRLAAFSSRKAVIPDFFEWDHAQSSGRTVHDKDDVLTLGFLGEISRRKGLLPFVRGAVSWAGQLAPDRRLRLNIGGSPRPGSEAYFRQVQELSRRATNIEVNFLGRISHRDRGAFYSQIDCLFAPSLFESYCLTILEALACGCAIVCGPNIGVLEFLPSDPDISILEDLSPAAVAGALDRLVARGIRRDPDRQRTAEMAKGAIGAINSRAAHSWRTVLRLV